ncbi:uncharacterized protein LOC110746202 [Prunus avium]|uniref:Uncharacterized protein LOC110746202 n=1 Tax=Prunus avium TaxID=42229 RepID=A0A6P5RB09_PRUAV|nr:uncharacterized protein LOC110746202 [Prunus avium]
MGFRLPGIVHAKKNQAPSKSLDVPKGYFAVYVGESKKKRFVIPVSYLNQSSFQDLLSLAEEEFGYDHPMGGITIPFLVLLFRNFKTMGFRLPGIVHAKKNKAPSKSLDVPKGYFAVYVGEGEKKRFVIPVSYLNQPSFQDLLTRAEDEFGYDHPMGAITIPCSENTFLDLTSSFGV